MKRANTTPEAHRIALPQRRVLLMASVIAIAGLLGPSGLASTSMAATGRETIQQVLPRIVKIYGAGGLQNLESYSTGFLISETGHIVTIWGHVLDPGTVTAVLDDGRRYKAELLGAEPRQQVAVLKLQTDEADFPHFDLNESEEVSAGRRILAFSNMFNVAAGDEPVSVLHGVVSARTTLQARRGAFEIPYDGPVYILDAVTNNSGAAGGVVTTRDGRLLAMIGKQLRDSKSNTWINYAIPVPVFRQVVENIRTGQFDSTGEDPLRTDGGSGLRPLDVGLVMLPNVVYRTPAYIESVIENSPAHEAGLRRNDLVLFVGEELVQSRRAVEEMLRRIQPGETLRLVVRRGDQLVTVEFPAPSPQ